MGRNEIIPNVNFLDSVSTSKTHRPIEKLNCCYKIGKFFPTIIEKQKEITNSAYALIVPLMSGTP